MVVGVGESQIYICGLSSNIQVSITRSVRWMFSIRVRERTIFSGLVMAFVTPHYRVVGGTCVHECIMAVE